jgi:hypothetical protein
LLFFQSDYALLFFPFLLCFGYLFGSYLFCFPEMRRKALLVGCNTDSLYGAPWNDVILLRNILVSNAGFFSDDMSLILDNDPGNQPTARIIVEALQLMTINLLLFFGPR